MHPQSRRKRRQDIEYIFAECIFESGDRILTLGFLHNKEDPKRKRIQEAQAGLPPAEENRLEGFV
jgi:hypothetical protein